MEACKQTGRESVTLREAQGDARPGLGQEGQQDGGEELCQARDP